MQTLSLGAYFRRLGFFVIAAPRTIHNQRSGLRQCLLLDEARGVHRYSLPILPAFPDCPQAAEDYDCRDEETSHFTLGNRCPSIMKSLPSMSTGCRLYSFAATQPSLVRKPQARIRFSVKNRLIVGFTCPCGTAIRWKSVAFLNTHCPDSRTSGHSRLPMYS